MLEVLHCLVFRLKALVAVEGDLVIFKLESIQFLITPYYPGIGYAFLGVIVICMLIDVIILWKLPHPWAGPWPPYPGVESIGN